MPRLMGELPLRRSLLSASSAAALLSPPTSASVPRSDGDHLVRQRRVAFPAGGSGRVRVRSSSCVPIFLRFPSFACFAILLLSLLR